MLQQDSLNHISSTTMILIDGVKYSCIECIRGHRSSLCRHHARPLLQVRAKGRPNVHANGNPNHRIAVFAEEIDNNDNNGTRHGKGNCENKKIPVVILKASPKQVIDLNNGRVIGPYQEDTTIDESSKPPLPMINSNSFINTTSCCLNGISKPKKSCGCCSNKTNKNINKLKILKTYLRKHIKSENEPKFIDDSKLIQIKNENDDENGISGNKHSVIIDDDNDKDNNKINSSNDNLLYDVVKIPSCSIPGSCGCDSNCACEGCFVHGNVNMNNLNNNQFSNLINYANSNEIKMPHEIMSNYANKLSNMTNNQVESNISKGVTNSDTDIDNAFANDVLDIHNGSLNVQSHSQLDNIQNGELLIPNSNVTSNNQAPNNYMNLLNDNIYALQTDLGQQQLASQNHSLKPIQRHLQGYPQGEPQDDNDVESNVCSCSNDCDCFNCETHGIINGMKLDDLFNHMMPGDYKDLINSIGDGTNTSGNLTVTPIINSSSENVSNSSSESLGANPSNRKTSSCCRK